jgi:DnaJ homologue, subfamily C, member 28, conserved domain
MFAFERIAEEKIRAAIAAGEFEQLPGKGKPLSLDDYFSVRPEERMACLVLKNGGFLPEHLQLRKELETCLRQLEHGWEHCRQRLGKLLALWREARTNTIEPPRTDRRFFTLRFWKSWEQNAASGRGKRVDAVVAKPGQQTLQLKQLQRAYLDDRLWLRRQISEIANRADDIAQRVHEALVEKEIRDQRPVAFLLGSPGVSAKNILAQFDREFPALPLDDYAAKGHALRESS